MAARQLSSVLTGAFALAPTDAPCRVIAPQPGPYVPAYSSHPSQGQECLDVPFETYPPVPPCTSAATEAVEAELAALRRHWIHQHDALGHPVNEQNPVLVTESTPLSAVVTGQEAAAVGMTGEALATDDDELDNGVCGGGDIGYGALGNGDGDGGDDEDDDIGPPPLLAHTERPALEQIRPGPLRRDHIVRCDCGCGGVSVKSLGRAAPPRTRPETSAYLPAPTLDSFLLPRSKGDRSLLNAALAEAKAATLDNQMVLKGGCGPERVPLLENPHYPSCERYSSALCSSGELATYGQGEYQVPEYESMRPMSDALYELGVAEWRRAWPWLSAESQRCPPDLCACQRYDAWRGPRGAHAHAHATHAHHAHGQQARSRSRPRPRPRSRSRSHSHSRSRPRSRPGVPRGRRVHGDAYGHANFMGRAGCRQLRRRDRSQQRERHALLVRRVGGCRGGKGAARCAPCRRRHVGLATWRRHQAQVMSHCQTPRRAPLPSESPTASRLAYGYTPAVSNSTLFDLRHGVWFPKRKRGEARDGQRWAFMFRWSNGRTRSFDKAYPHRLQMTEEEKAGVVARKEAAAAEAKRWASPPESTHAMNKRARVQK